MRGIIPQDLEKQKVWWQSLSLDERIAIVKDVRENHLYNKYFSACALAITMIEQPREIPNDNAVGMHPWGKKFPWGWGKYYWAKYKPNGYVMLKEAQTKNYCVYFSFSLFSHCFDVVYKIVEKRQIIDGERYQAKWVGTILKKNSAFDRLRDKIFKLL